MKQYVVTNNIVHLSSISSYYEKFLATGEVKCIDEEIPFEIPKGWEWCRLRDVIMGTNAGKSPNCEKRPKRGEEWGVLTTTAIQENDFLPNENKVLPPNYSVNSEHSVKYGDILITRAGPVNRTGIVCLVDKECDNLILSDKTVRIDYFRNYCNPTFIVLVLNSPAIHELLMSVTVGMAASQVNVSQGNIQNTLIPFPGIKEQNRIAVKITNLLPIIERYNSEQEQLEELNAQLPSSLKKSLLQEAIQGKLVPQIESEGTAGELLSTIRKEKENLVKQGKLKKSSLSDSFIFKGDDNKYYEQIGSEVTDITDDIPFEIPINWTWVRLKDLCTINTGVTFKKEEISSDNKGIRVLRGGNIQRFQLCIKTDDLFIPEEKVKKSILLKQNDIVTPAVTSLENIGKMARIEMDMCNTTVGGFVFIIRPFGASVYFSKYLLTFMSSPTAIEYMKSITNKSGQAFYNIGKERLMNALVPVPPLAEQGRIDRQITDVFSRIKA